VYDTVTVSRQVRLKDVAAAVDASEKELIGLNPELRYKLLPGDQYSLRVPAKKGDVLMAKIEQIPVSNLPQASYRYHRVRKGETLSVIARRYRTSASKIARANKIRTTSIIRVGQRLKIPQSGTVVASRTSRNKKSYGQVSRHVVKRGDSLWNLARKYGTTTKKIQRANNLRSSRLSIGQVLKIPGAAADTAPQSQSKIYRVKSGDSPFKIAQMHNMPLERFLRTNKLTPRSKIYPGQKVYVE